jgi:hypothetical protein
MCSSLLLDSLRQTTQLIARMRGLPQHRFALCGLHLRYRRAGQSAMSAVYDRHHRLQIAK